MNFLRGILNSSSQAPKSDKLEPYRKCLKINSKAAAKAKSKLGSTLRIIPRRDSENFHYINLLNGSNLDIFLDPFLSKNLAKFLKSMSSKWAELISRYLGKFPVTLPALSQFASSKAGDSFLFSQIVGEESKNDFFVYGVKFLETLKYFSQNNDKLVSDLNKKHFCSCLMLVLFVLIYDEKISLPTESKFEVVLKLRDLVRWIIDFESSVLDIAETGVFRNIVEISEENSSDLRLRHVFASQILFLLSDREISLSIFYKNFKDYRLLDNYFQNFEKPEHYSPFVLKMKILIAYRIIKIFNNDKTLKNALNDSSFYKNFKKIIKYFLKMERIDAVSNTEEEKILSLDEIRSQTEGIAKFFPGEGLIEPVVQQMFNFCFLYDKTSESKYLRNRLKSSIMINSVINNKDALIIIKELFLEVRNNDFRYNVVEQIFLFMSYNEINFDTISIFIPIETFVSDLSSLDERLFNAIKKLVHYSLITETKSVLTENILKILNDLLCFKDFSKEMMEKLSGMIFKDCCHIIADFLEKRPTHSELVLKSGIIGTFCEMFCNFSALIVNMKKIDQRVNENYSILYSAIKDDESAMDKFMQALIEAIKSYEGNKKEFQNRVDFSYAMMWYERTSYHKQISKLIKYFFDENLISTYIKRVKENGLQSTTSIFNLHAILNTIKYRETELTEDELSLFLEFSRFELFEADLLVQNMVFAAENNKRGDGRKALELVLDCLTVFLKHSKENKQLYWNKANMEKFENFCHENNILGSSIAEIFIGLIINVMTGTLNSSKKGKEISLIRNAECCSLLFHLIYKIKDKSSKRKILLYTLQKLNQLINLFVGEKRSKIYCNREKMARSDSLNTFLDLFFEDEQPFVNMGPGPSKNDLLSIQSKTFITSLAGHYVTKPGLKKLIKKFKNIETFCGIVDEMKAMHPTLSFFEFHFPPSFVKVAPEKFWSENYTISFWIYIEQLDTTSVNFATLFSFKEIGTRKNLASMHINGQRICYTSHNRVFFLDSPIKMRKWYNITIINNANPTSPGVKTNFLINSTAFHVEDWVAKDADSFLAKNFFGKIGNGSSSNLKEIWHIANFFLLGKLLKKSEVDSVYYRGPFYTNDPEFSSEMITNLEPNALVGDHVSNPKKRPILNRNTFTINVVNISDSIRKVGGVYLLLQKLELVNTPETFLCLLETLFRLLHQNSINLKQMEMANGYALLKNLVKKKAAMLDESIVRAYFSLIEGQTPDSYGEAERTPVLFHKTDEDGQRYLAVIHKRKSFRLTMSTTRFKSTSVEIEARPVRRSIIPNVSHDSILVCDEKSVTDNASGKVDGRYARQRYRSIQGEKNADSDARLCVIANALAFDIVPDFFMIWNELKPGVRVCVLDWLTKMVAEGPTVEKVAELTVTTEKTEPVVDFCLTALMKDAKGIEKQFPVTDFGIALGNFWNFNVFEKTNIFYKLTDFSLSLRPGSEEIPRFGKLARAIFCRGFSDNFCELVMFQIARHFKRKHNNIAVIEAFVEILTEYAKKIEDITSDYKDAQDLRLKLELRTKNVLMMLQETHIPPLCEKMLCLLTWLNRKRFRFSSFNDLLGNYTLHCDCGNGPQIFYVLFRMLFGETLESSDDFVKMDRGDLITFFTGEVKVLIGSQVEPSFEILKLILTKMVEITKEDVGLFFAVMNSFSLVYRNKANVRNYISQNTGLAAKVVAKLSQMNTVLNMSVLETNEFNIQFLLNLVSSARFPINFFEIIHFCSKQPGVVSLSSLSDNLFNLAIVIKNAFAINFGVLLEKNEYFSANFALLLNEISLSFVKYKLSDETYEDFLQVIHFCILKLKKTGVRDFETALKAFKQFLLSFLTKMKSKELAEVERFIKIKQISEIDVFGLKNIFVPSVLLRLMPALMSEKKLERTQAARILLFMLGENGAEIERIFSKSEEPFSQTIKQAFGSLLADGDLDKFDDWATGELGRIYFELAPLLDEEEKGILADFESGKHDEMREKVLNDIRLNEKKNEESMEEFRRQIRERKGEMCETLYSKWRIYSLFEENKVKYDKSVEQNAVKAMERKLSLELSFLADSEPTPCDRWMLDFTETDTRMRKKLIRNYRFFKNYDICPAPDPDNPSAPAADSPLGRELHLNTKGLLNIERAILLQKKRQSDAARESPRAAQSTKESVSRFAPFIEKRDFEGQIVLVDVKVIQFLNEKDGILSLCEKNFYFFEGFYSHGKTINYRSARAAERYAAVKKPDGGGRELLSFFKRGVTDLKKTKAWMQTPEFKKFDYARVLKISKKKYNLQRNTLEVFLDDNTNFLLVFPNASQRRKVLARFVEKIEPATQRSVVKGVIETYFDHRRETRLWKEGALSNFAYLMLLNDNAGRSYNDLAQYPVMPWVLKDFQSQDLDLANKNTFRDLGKPIGALRPDRAEKFAQRYAEWDEAATGVPKFHYGTHYSMPAGVLYYLARLEPFARAALEIHDGAFDIADRMFASVQRTWHAEADELYTSDVKELVPEFFYLPAFLRNANGFDFGPTQQGAPVDAVELPAWARASAHVFAHKHRAALESDYVSERLHHWIDLVFGHRQRGPPAVEALNVFYHLTYDGSTDFIARLDRAERERTLVQINSFGQTPRQLFASPHPRREPFGCKLRGECLSERCAGLAVRAAAGGEGSGAGGLFCRGAAVCAERRGRVRVPPGNARFFRFSRRRRALELFSETVGGAGAKQLEKSFPHAVDEPVAILSVSEDGAFLAASAQDSVVYLWAVDQARWTLRELARFCAHDGAVSAVALSSNYRVLLTASTEILQWDVNRRVLVRRFGGGCGRVACLAIDNEEGNVFASDGDGVYVWDVNGELLAKVNGLSATKSKATCLAINQEAHYVSDKLLLTGHAAGHVCVWRFGVNETRLDPAQEDKLPMALRLETELGVGASEIVSIITNKDVKGKFWCLDKSGVLSEIGRQENEL